MYDLYGIIIITHAVGVNAVNRNPRCDRCDVNLNWTLERCRRERIIMIRQLNCHSQNE